MRKILLSALLLNAFVSMAQVTLSNSPYVENFDNIGNGLPAGFSVQTGSTPSAPGTNSTFTSSPSPWLSTTAGGFYNCASATGLTSTSNSNQQSLSTNRALCVRQTANFGNPGAAFVFKIANTTNKTNFQLTFRVVSLDSTAQAITAWAVDYGFGSSPSFSSTGVLLSPLNIRTGGKPGPTNTYKFFSDVTVNFGTSLDNKSDIVWIRVWTPFATTTTTSTLLGFNGIPTMSGIDDWNLSWTAPPPTNVFERNILTNTKISGFIGNDINIQFNENFTGNTSIRLTSMNGSVIWEKQYGRIQSNQSEWVRPGQLPKGMYLLQIQNVQGNITKRIAN